MRYYLHQEKDLTWENALPVARRWEAAHDNSDCDGDVCAINGNDEAHNGNLTLDALSKEVKKNTEDIKEIKRGQAELSASFAAMTER